MSNKEYKYSDADRLKMLEAEKKANKGVKRGMNCLTRASLSKGHK